VAPSAAPVVLPAGAIEQPAVQAQEAAPAPAPKTAARPSRVRIRNVEKRVIAADATRSVTEPLVAAIEPVVPADAPSVVAEPQPQAAPAVAQIELPKLDLPQPEAAPEAELPAPKPIILSTISPPAPATDLAPASAPSGAREISVSISEASVARGAVSKGSLRSTLNQAAITRCYRDAVRAGTAPGQAFQAQLEIETNTSGRITSAKLSGGGLPKSMVDCVEQAARLGRVREADTGEVNASFVLTFR
ncbi:MAG TPA: hypothetical protein VJR89_41640, partial [Polyangiales bacterium]|nr:hypothetical protein [Polyangiales bacterium]